MAKPNGYRGRQNAWARGRHVGTSLPARDKNALTARCRREGVSIAAGREVILRELGREAK